MKKTLITLLTLASLTSFAQNPAPAKPQARTTALMNGIIHVGNGQVIPNGVIIFENGIITNVADATIVRLDMTNMDVVNVAGKHVYPGIISPA